MSFLYFPGRCLPGFYLFARLNLTALCLHKLLLFRFRSFCVLFYWSWKRQTFFQLGHISTSYSPGPFLCQSFCIYLFEFILFCFMHKPFLPLLTMSMHFLLLLFIFLSLTYHTFICNVKIFFLNFRAMPIRCSH